MLTASEVSPEGLAIALTLLEGDRYRQIMPCDYLANQCGRPGYNNVDAACSVTHKIILWIKQSLLYYDALQSRAAVLKFFINTANVRYNLVFASL
jgi:son of sevenless-like protein